MLWWLLGASLGCGTIAWVTNHLALIPWRRSQGAHWTERARLLFPVKTAASVNLYLIPANAMLATLWMAPEAPWPAFGLAAWLGVLVASWPLDRETMPWVTWRDWRREVTVAWIFRFARWFVLIGAMLAVPDTIEWSTWLAAAAVIGVQAYLVWGGGLWLSRRLGLISPAPASLRACVEAAADQAGARVRGIWTLRSVTANAIATPFTQAVLFTERALNHCPPDELAAIAAHEIGHLTESTWIQVCRFLGTLAWVPWVFLRPLWNLYGPPAVLCLGAATWLMYFGMQRLSHRLELRADAAAKQHAPDEGAFARALARLYELNQVPAVLHGRRHSHPHLYDRLIAAGVTPEYPRPEPAQALAWPGHVQSALLGLLLMKAVLRWFIAD